MGPAGRQKFEHTGRRVFGHDVPPWIDPDASDYFITVCCKQRGENQLCLPDVGGALMESARFYHLKQKWLPWVFILMPDHAHRIAGFGRQYRIEAVVENWKRYAATKHRVVWQRGFFEHRLRGNESVEEKAEYIRQNPVRAGLVENVKELAFLVGGTRLMNVRARRKIWERLGEPSLPWFRRRWRGGMCPHLTARATRTPPPRRSRRGSGYPRTS